MRRIQCRYKCRCLIVFWHQNQYRNQLAVQNLKNQIQNCLENGIKLAGTGQNFTMSLQVCH